MATFKLQSDTVSLLSDETKAKFDSDGKIIELHEINDELREIAIRFLEVYSWIGSFTWEDYSEDSHISLLCGKEFSQQTIEVIQPDGTSIHFLMKHTEDKEGNHHFEREPFPDGVPNKCKFDVFFDKEKGLLHVTINPKIEIEIVRTQKEGMHLVPEQAALFRLFLRHPDGLIATEIFTRADLFKEFISLYRNEWNEPEDSKDVDFVKRLDSKIKKLMEMPKQNKAKLSNIIHRMICDLNATLEKYEDKCFKYFEVRQFQTKQKGALYFIPLVFLNERDYIKVDSKGKPIENE